jgi:hypothetical protein
MQIHSLITKTSRQTLLNVIQTKKRKNTGLNQNFCIVSTKLYFHNQITNVWHSCNLLPQSNQVLQCYGKPEDAHGTFATQLYIQDNANNLTV